MKSCPNCGEILGDPVEVCFKCNYSFKLHTVITNSSTASEVEESRLTLNPLYEYAVVAISDKSSGQVDIQKLQETLSTYASARWRLRSAFSSEYGKNTMSAAISGIGTGTNATMDQVVLIFERCIKASE